MSTNIRLDEVDGNWMIVESAVLKSTASDFILDAPSRNTTGGFRRALVHDSRDGLTINFNGDYPGGVTVDGDLRVTGSLLLPSNGPGVLSDVIGRLRADVAELKLDRARFDETRVDRLEQSIATLAELMQASVVPPWRTKEEVEKGDDMAILYKSAEDLGFRVDWIVLQNDPRYNPDEVVRIDPPAGSVALRGSIIRVTVNLVE